MSEKNDFIQLPPIKKDTPSEVVSMIWQYLKLPEESRKRVTADLIDVDENCEKEDFQIPDLYDIVPKEEIAEFEETMRKIIAGIISQASSVATWVYVQKYVKHKTLDEMLQEWKGLYPNRMPHSIPSTPDQVKTTLALFLYSSIFLQSVANLTPWSSP